MHSTCSLSIQCGTFQRGIGALAWKLLVLGSQFSIAYFYCLIVTQLKASCVRNWHAKFLGRFSDIYTDITIVQLSGMTSSSSFPYNFSKTLHALQRISCWEWWHGFHNVLFPPPKRPIRRRTGQTFFMILIVTVCFLLIFHFE